MVGATCHLGQNRRYVGVGPALLCEKRLRCSTLVPFCIQLSCQALAHRHPPTPTQPSEVLPAVSWVPTGWVLNSHDPKRIHWVGVWTLQRLARGCKLIMQFGILRAG